MGRSKDLATLKSGLSIDGTLTTTSTGTNLTSNSYNVVKIQTDKDDNGSNDDAILQFTTGSSNTVKGELRYDESESMFEIGHGDNQGHIRIDSSGRVLNPNQPGFQADGNFGWRDYASYTVVPTWRTTSAGQFNIGNHFNHNTGVFTCPVAGRYLINISAYVNNDGDQYHTGRIGRNGAYWGDNLMTYQNSDTQYPDNSMSASYIMNASANDTITYYHKGDIYGYHTNWSIYLLG